MGQLLAAEKNVNSSNTVSSFFKLVTYSNLGSKITKLKLEFFKDGSKAL